MPTPSSNATAYATASDLLAWRDERRIRDLLNDDDTRFTGSLTSPVPDKITRCLAAASGEWESACFVGGRYTAADLTALTGNSQAYFVWLVAVRAFAKLRGRRRPTEEEVADEGEAATVLEQVRVGERIFAIQEVANAGAGIEATPLSKDIASTAANNPPVPVSEVASAFFGDRARDLMNSGRRRWGC